MDPSWLSGCWNWREYWMKAWMSPSGKAPLATMMPPTTAIATYTRFPTNIVAGMMMPHTNCAPKLAS